MKTIGALVAVIAWLAGGAARVEGAAAADGPVLPLPNEDVEAFWVIHIDTTTAKVLAAVE